MFTRDFILRQIHQLTQVLARVMLLKSQQHPTEAFQEINQAFSGTPGLEPFLRLDLTREEVLEPCISESAFSADMGLALADLLWEKALLFADQTGPDATAYRQYALWLYETAAVQKNATVPLDLYQRIAWLREHP